MIFNILDNTTEFWMKKYIVGEIFSSGGATFYKSYSDQTVRMSKSGFFPIFFSRENILNYYFFDNIITIKVEF